MEEPETPVNAGTEPPTPGTEPPIPASEGPTTAPIVESPPPAEPFTPASETPTEPLAAAPRRDSLGTAALNALREFGSRGPVRLGLVGLLLLVLGLTGHSVWAVPALIVGLVMVVVAWAGPRLSGRVVLDWGESGFQVEMKAAVRSTRHHFVTHEHPETLPAPIPLNPRPAPAPKPKVEIDADELTALIAAAQRASGTGR
jgi:hypothetical protein